MKGWPYIGVDLKPNSQRIQPWCWIEFRLLCWIQPQGTPSEVMWLNSAANKWLNSAGKNPHFGGWIGEFWLNFSYFRQDVQILCEFNFLPGWWIHWVFLYMLTEFSGDVQIQWVCHLTYWMKMFCESGFWTLEFIWIMASLGLSLSSSELRQTLGYPWVHLRGQP